MPGSHVPVDQQFGAWMASIEARVGASERSQQLVFTDPTGAAGDPSHGHATVVIGSLKAITGINAFGIASFKTGSWVQL